MPAAGEHVIGLVLARHAEHFSVDIGSSSLAILPLLAFEGATRRNRPNIKSGTLVYARVTSADRDMETEISCVDEDGRASGYGELKEDYGYVVQVSTCDSRELLLHMSNDESKDGPIGALKKRLKSFGESMPFEMIVGMNGRIWLRAEEAGEVLKLAGEIRVAFDSDVFGQGYKPLPDEPVQSR